MTRISELMTPNPVALAKDATAADAARQMRDHDIGDVLVLDGSTVTGIVTDRDLVTRVLATGGDGSTPLSSCCSLDPVTADADDDVDTVVESLKETAIRRVPVVSAGQLVGVVSLGDLAIDKDPRSALAEISAAPPSR